MRLCSKHAYFGGTYLVKTRQKYAYVIYEWPGKVQKGLDVRYQWNNVAWIKLAMDVSSLDRGQYYLNVV